MSKLGPTKENTEHGPNESVSEQTELMSDCVVRKDQLDEPKMTAPSTANETHDNGTRNNDSDSSQVGPKESSTVKNQPRKVITWESSLTSRRKMHSRVTFGLSIINLIIAITLSILVIAVKPQKPPACRSCPSCPEDWITWRGKCYYFSDAERTWNSSQNNCSWHGASLFVPGPEKEMAFIRRIVGNTESWIGLWREKEGQPWKRPDGSVFNSSFEIRAKGPCAYLDKKTTGSTWCDTERNWICTKSLPVV